MTIKFSLSSDPAESSASPCVVVGVFEERVLSAAAARIDEKSGGAIKRLIEAGDVNGKPGTSQLLFGVANVTAPRVLVVGLGEQKKFDAARFQRACAEAARVLKGLPIDGAVSYLTESKSRQRMQPGSRARRRWPPTRKRTSTAPRSSRVRNPGTRSSARSHSPRRQVRRQHWARPRRSPRACASRANSATCRRTSAPRPTSQNRRKSWRRNIRA